MKLSTRARYAVRLMVGIIKGTKEGTPVTLQEIAQRSRISQRYLEQLAIPLKNANLIVGVSGRHGGYKLKRPPSTITIGQIVQASIGPINISECVGDPAGCINSDFCECRNLWSLINHKIVSVLDEYTLEDLASNKPLDELNKNQRQPSVPGEEG